MRVVVIREYTILHLRTALTLNPAMQKATYFIIVGSVFYIISLLLPAFMHFKGYETAVIALMIPFEGSTYNVFTSFHLFFLGIHNILLVATLVMARSLMEGRHVWLLWVLLISVLNVIGFFLFAACENGISDLQIGYYIWALASLFIAGGLFWRRQNFNRPDTTINDG